jgi:hypothetical protein
MKKLYFLDEEEKNRILNIHESSTKRQYLKEQSDSSEIIYQKLVAASAGTTDEDGLIKAFNLIKSSNEFLKINNLFAKKFGGGYSSIERLINGEMDKEDLKYVKQISQKLKSIGVQNTFTEYSGNSYGTGSFKIVLPTSSVQQPPATTTPPASTTTPDATTKPKPNVQQRRQQIIQQIKNTTNSIQKALGQTPTGTMDSSQVERLIGLLQQ